MGNDSRRVDTHIGGGGDDILLGILGLGLAVRRVASDRRVSNCTDGRRSSGAAAAVVLAKATCVTGS